MRRRAAIVALSCVAAAHAAGAADEGRFGSKGQFVPSGSVSFSRSSISLAGTTGTLSTIALTPTLLYFAADNLALGVSATLLRQTASQGDTSDTLTAYGLAPVALYNLWLSPRASLAPQVGIAFSSRDVDVSPSGSNPSLTTISLQIFVPVLFHPVRHFFLGFGPAFSYDLSASLSNAAGDAPKTTAIGAQTVLGGYF